MTPRLDRAQLDVDAIRQAIIVIELACKMLLALKPILDGIIREKSK